MSGKISVLGLLLLSLLIVGPGCSRGPTQPNIVVVVLDTVRRDATGLVDRPAPWSAYDHSLTPNLDRLATEGTVFTNVWSASPWTAPSHASMFTGMLPSQHYCTHQYTHLQETMPTFAELLTGDGYETAAFFSNPWLADRTTGMLRGFAARREAAIGNIFQLTSGAGDQGGRQSLRNISNWLEERDDNKPVLLFVNFLEAHLPYDPPLIYRSRHMPDSDQTGDIGIEWGHEYNAGLHAPDKVDWPRIRRFYGADVWSADEFLGQLRKTLSEAGLWDDAYVIVTSDHGENLGENTMFGHQFSLLETVLAVPLVLKYPQGQEPPGLREDPAMLTDLFATVLDIAGHAPRELPLHSRSLVGEPSLPDRLLISQYSGPSQGMLNLLQGRNPDLDISQLKLPLLGIRQGDLRLTVAGGKHIVLNDISRDPEQKLDISADRPDDVQRLMKLLEVLSGDPGARPVKEIEMDEATRRQLESLGYVAK